MEDPYTGMNIAGATGMSEAQKLALKALGAVEKMAKSGDRRGMIARRSPLV
jgi:hypothetical protein